MIPKVTMITKMKKKIFNEDINEDVEATPKTIINAKVVGAMKNLQALYNADANKTVKQATEEKCHLKFKFLNDLAMMTSDIKSKLEEPQMFNEAWNHPNEESHRKWQEATCKEFTDMIKQQVWQTTLKSLMLPSHRCIKNKWVVKVERNCVYWVHLVACGYNKVPDIDFSKN